MTINLLDFSLKHLQTFFAEIGEPTFRATQVIKWIHQKGVSDVVQMTDLSKSLRQKLLDTTTISFPEIMQEQVSQDGTTKWVIRLHDGQCIETVFIPERGRGTLCVSSQVGCAINCSFCSTAQQGFNRNLSVGEIISQVWLARERLNSKVCNKAENPNIKDNCSQKLDFQRGAARSEQRSLHLVNEHASKGCNKAENPISKSNAKSITNVVMMGMGEPLLNFDNVVSAMELMMEDNAYNLSKYRVTLSTSGIIPAMYKLAEVSEVSLAVSLHAATDELRNTLVPINKKYPVAELMLACKNYFKNDPRRQVTFEYVMLEGINDSPADARALIKILQGIPAKVNLIPFNPFPATKYRRSNLAIIERFQAILSAAGINTITRKTRGDDIDAACGQLVGKVIDRTYRGKQRIIPLTLEQ